MAEDDFFWIEVENEDETILNMDIYAEFMRQRLKMLVNELADDGVAFLGKNVPQGTFYSEGYTLRHVGRTDVEGEHSEGEYEATVGIKAGTSYHPVYVNRGTGVFGPFVKQPYSTKPPGGLMWFYAERIGRRIGRETVKGQRAQHFLYTTFRELQVFAGARMNLGYY